MSQRTTSARYLALCLFLLSLLAGSLAPWDDGVSVGRTYSISPSPTPTATTTGQG